jgi:cell division protein FtsL
MPRSAAAPVRAPRPPAGGGRVPARARSGARVNSPPPRRASGPARPLLAARGAAGGAVALPGRILRAPFGRMARARGTSVLDALLRGRAWIALVGVLLAGIVFFNVDLLRLNREIASTSEQSAALGRANSRLLLELARLGSSERIQKAAAERGLVLPAPGDVRYLRARQKRDGRLAARRMIAPDPTAHEATAPAAPTTTTPAPPAPTTTTPAPAAPTTTTPAPAAPATTPTTTAPPGPAVTTTPAEPQAPETAPSG